MNYGSNLNRPTTRNSLLIVAATLLFCLHTPVRGAIDRLPALGAQHLNAEYIVNLSNPYETLEEPSMDRVASIAVSGDVVHVVYYSRTHDYTGRWVYRYSTDRGVNWDGRALSIDSNDNHHYIPETMTFKQLAVSGDYVHFVYLKQGGVTYARSENGGRTWDEPVVVSEQFYDDKPNMLVVQAEENRLAIAYSVAGSTYMTGETNGSAVEVYVSEDYGQTFTNKYPVFSESSGLYLHDMAIDGDNIYLLYHDSPGRVRLMSSNDFGQTYPYEHIINQPAQDGDTLDYVATRAQNYNYSPKLAATDGKVFAVWMNVDTTDYQCAGRSVRVATSLDGGETLDSYDGGYTLVSYPNNSCASTFDGDETIAASGSRVFVMQQDREDKNVYLYASSDNFHNWKKTALTNGKGIQPQMAIDPMYPNGEKIHFLPRWNMHRYYHGESPEVETISGLINYGMPAFYRLDRPRLVAQDDVVYWVADGCLEWCDRDTDIFFARATIPFDPEPVASGAEPEVLSLTDIGAEDRIFDCVQIREQESLKITDKFTIAMWARKQSENWASFLRKSRWSSSWNSLSMILNYYGGTKPVIEAQLTTSGMDDLYAGLRLRSDEVDPAAWHHLAMTYDASASGDNFKLFVDGEVADQAEVSGEVLMDPMPYWLGEVSNNGANHNFLIDDLAFFNEALNDAEIGQLMSGPPNPLDSRLLALFTFDGGSFADATGNGNDAVPNLNPTTFAGAPPYVAAPADLWTDIGGWFDGLDGSQAPNIWTNAIGWISSSSDDKDSLMFFSPGSLGFFWTSETVYPWVWSFGQGGWFYFYAGSGAGDGTGAWFYDLNGGQNVWLVN